jgi:hypothetical protein
MDPWGPYGPLNQPNSIWLRMHFNKQINFIQCIHNA